VGGKSLMAPQEPFSGQAQTLILLTSAGISTLGAESQEDGRLKNSSDGVL
jgi:hypothetical protein